MKKIITTILLLIVLSIQSQTNQKTDKTHLQTFGHVFKTSFNTIPNDFVQMGSEFSSDWKRTGYYAAGILGLIATDRITTSAWQRNIEPNIVYELPDITLEPFKNSRNTWMKGSSAYLTYPIVGMYLGSLITNNENGQFAAANSFKAILYSTIITQVTLKTIFGRNRPFRPLGSQRVDPGLPVNPNDWTNNNWDFFNGREGNYILSSVRGTSLPSMHVTTYFALAKVIQMEFDNYWIPYGVMTAVFFSDVRGHNHWISDMVLGGILGTVIGRSIVLSSWKARGINGYQEKEKKISFNIVPQFSGDYTGLHLVATF